MSEYSLGPDIIAVGGMGLTDNIKNALGPNYAIILAVIVVLVVALIYYVFIKEKFNPTSTLAAQRAALSGSEAFAPLNIPAQFYTSGNRQLSPEATAWCATANAAPNDDAWSWMVEGSRTEGMKGNKTDNQLSAIARGY